MLEDLKVIEYELAVVDGFFYNVTLRLRSGINRERWSISLGDSCLSKTPDERGRLGFEFELIPSSRTEDYYREYRFDTAENAYRFWLENKHRIYPVSFSTGVRID